MDTVRPFDSHPGGAACDAGVLYSEADRLIEALEDCMHPRAQRLRSCLKRAPQGIELERLRVEVISLLILSFGKCEAYRRLERL